VTGRIWKYLFKQSGGCLGQKEAHQVERFALPEVFVAAGPAEPAQEGEEFGRLGPVEENPVHRNPNFLRVLRNP